MQKMVPVNIKKAATLSLSDSKCVCLCVCAYVAGSTSGYEVVVLRNDEAVWCVCLHEPVRRGTPAVLTWEPCCLIRH